MNLKEDIHAQNVQLKIANKDLTVKLNNAISEKFKAGSIAYEYRLQLHILFVVLVVSIFFNIFAYCMLTNQQQCETIHAYKHGACQNEVTK